MAKAPGTRAPQASGRRVIGAAERDGDPKAFATSVGEAVRRARQQCGFTQAELAERAGLSSNYVARLERGELGPSLFVANALCAALGIEVAALLGDGTSPARTTRRRRLGA